MDLRDLVRRVGAAALTCTVLSTVVYQTACAGEPRLVFDINTAPVETSSYPGTFQDQGAWSWFIAQDSVSGFEPWRTDGSVAGTYQLADVIGGESGATGRGALPVGARSFFLDNGKLWVTDGTKSGTRTVTAVTTNDPGLNTDLIGPLAGDLLFKMMDAGTGTWQLWRTDGTELGTRRVVTIGNSGTIGLIEALITGQHLYFLFQSGPDRIEVWRSDGTAAGSTRLGIVEEAAEASHLQLLGDQILFLTSSFGMPMTVWRIDRPVGSVEQVTTLPTPSPGGGAHSVGFAAIGDAAIFVPNGIPGVWRSDGTAAGTFQLTAATPSPSSGMSGVLSSGRRAFVALEGQNGFDLWATDGTVASTSVIHDLPQGTGTAFATVGSTLLVNNGLQMWRSDGTVAGTSPLAGVPPSTGQMEVTGVGDTVYLRISVSMGLPRMMSLYRYDLASDASSLLRTYDAGQNPTSNSVFAVARGQLYFDGRDASTGIELWISDGTAGGTRMVKNIAPETSNAPSRPDHFIEFRERLYFSAHIPVIGRELWRTAGTANTTEMFADISGALGGSDPRDMFVVNDRLMLFARDTSARYRLWRTEGMLDDIVQVANLYAPGIGGVPRECDSSRPVLNGFAYFAAHEPASGLELWRSDGTAAGTSRVADINSGAAHSSPCWLTVHQGKLYFAAGDGAGKELWVSDGTAAGTSRVRSAPVAQGSSPQQLLSLNAALYYISTGTTPAQLWRSDGTSAGTVAVTDEALLGADTSVVTLRSANRALLFAAAAPSQSTRLWASDGSRQGTARPENVPFLSAPLFTTARHGYFLSQGPDAADDIEPWVSDGTPSGSQLLLNVTQGGTAVVSDFMDFAGLAAFQQLDPTGGPTLWKSNGTASGTRRHGTLNGPVFEAGATNRLTALHTLFFVVDDRDIGAELYALANERPVAAADSVTMQAGTSVTVNVLSNDIDPDGLLDAASLRIEVPPNAGTAVVNPSGTITYSAPASFSGTQQLRYTVADEQGLLGAADVQFTVNAPNPVPPVNPPPAGGGGGGGGQLGGLGVLGLLLAFAMRRRTLVSAHPASAEQPCSAS